MSESLRLKIPQGMLQGCTGKNFDGEIFYQFLGLPYAKPPIGPLRFKEPQPVENWSGLRDATKTGTQCYSIDNFSGKPEGSEDCLFLNIYTKSFYSDTTNKSLKPVMVWFHSGAFIRGTNSPKLYGPEFLMTEDIVLVTVQYRIGILGFLRLQDPALEIFGNAGLKDQTMALKYINEIIPYFGGDRNNVTIFGNSAGATSVGYHTLSSLSKGLFHKAIIQSGSAIKGWDECVHNAVKIAQTVDSSITTEEQALRLFQHLPVEKLFNVQSEYIKVEEIGTLNKQFGPVVEHPDSKNPFINKPPIDIITSGNYNDVPIIIGYNSSEGISFDYYRMINPNRIMTVDSAIPSSFNLEKGSNQRKNLENELKDFYLKTGNYDDNLRELLGDVGYVTPSYATAVNHAKSSKHPVYLYRCTLDTSINYLKSRLNLSQLPGTCHFDEVSYIFNNIITAKKSKLEKLEENSIRTMVKLWTNFAKFGKPTPDDELLGYQWNPFTNKEHNFLNIGNELFSGVSPDKTRIDFWTELYRKYTATKDFL